MAKYMGIIFTQILGNVVFYFPIVFNYSLIGLEKS